MSKKGTSLWISYILLTLLIISLGALYLNWSAKFTKDTLNSTIIRTDTQKLCSDISIRPIDAYQLNPNNVSKGLYIKIQNNNRVTINGIIVHTFKDDKQIGKPYEKDITIRPSETKETIIDDYAATVLHIIPYTYIDNMKIVCPEKKESIII